METEARQLRAKIYGECSDSTWETVKESWIKDIAWLRTNQNKLKFEYSPYVPKPSGITV